MLFFFFSFLVLDNSLFSFSLQNLPCATQFPCTTSIQDPCCTLKKNKTTQNKNKHALTPVKTAGIQESSFHVQVGNFHFHQGFFSAMRSVHNCRDLCWDSSLQLPTFKTLVSGTEDPEKVANQETPKARHMHNRDQRQRFKLDASQPHFVFDLVYKHQ